MQRLHFEAFAPLCPRCLTAGEPPAELIVATVFNGDETSVSSGVLHCSSPSCQQEYPIIDGVPIIVPDVRTTLAAQANHILARDDLLPVLQGMLGDALGDASEFNMRRQHLSIYGWDGYAEFATPPVQTGPAMTKPGAVARCLEQALGLLDSLPGPVIDMGCAVGRSTLELGGLTGSPVLGIDLSFPMLQFAQRVRQTGQASFPLREAGVVYHPTTVETPFRNPANVDFWLCDAMALPFGGGSAGTVTALNLLDCVPSPLQLLNNIEALLADDGVMLAGCPYDWSSGANPMEQWIGGHSQRGEFEGSSERLLEALLTPGGHIQSLERLRLIASEANVPWQTRLHARSVNQYLIHLVAARKAGLSERA